MIRRLGLVAALAAVAAMVALPLGLAGAAAKKPHPATPVKTSTTNPLSGIAMTGTSRNGKTFTGTFTVRRFVVRSHQGTRAVYALGTLRGKIGNRRTPPRTVLIPASIAGASSAQAASCSILHLTLGPLDLNLLGLRVQLNQVVLDITGQTGPGNLLGNLLCDVANLANSNPLTGSQLASVLNAVADLLRGL